jgi:CheY-like chemotaxis protein
LTITTETDSGRLGSMARPAPAFLATREPETEAGIRDARGRLELVRARAVATFRARTDPPPTCRPDLLLVEDDAIDAKATVRALAEQGFPVRVATTLAEARAVDLLSVGVLVLDLGLPDGSGWSFVEEVPKRVAVVIYSGSTPPELCVRASQLGVAVVEKSFDGGKKLVEVVLRMLGAWVEQAIAR